MPVIISGSDGINQSGVSGATMLPSGTTAERPLNPTNGMMRYNTEKGFVEFYIQEIDTWLDISQSTLGLTSLNPAPNARALRDSGVFESGFYFIKLPEWSAPKSVYCDMENDGGGWMLWGQRLSSSADIDIRESGYLFSVQSDSGLLNEWTDTSVSGHIDFWPYFDGQRELRWHNNVTNVTSTNAIGDSFEKLLIARENGTSIANTKYWDANNWPGGTTCPSDQSIRYDYVRIFASSKWFNNHTSGGNTCSGFGFNSDHQNITNWYSATDNSNGYSPRNKLFGNGASGYYNHGNSYDHDRLDFNLTASFNGASIETNNNQIWVR